MSDNMPPFLSYGRQQIDDDDVAAVAACLRSDWLTTGPQIDAFEAELAQRLSVPHVIVCSSGTSALHLACLAAGLGPGTVAIVPSLTFVATANAVRFAGAEVVFSDVDPLSGLMRAQDLENAIARQRDAYPDLPLIAALPVHMNGQTADMDALRDVANNAGIRLIEDACHALGAEHEIAVEGASREWRPVGSCQAGWAACFSFHPVKSITTGEGGAVVLRDDAAAARIRRLRNHGLEPAGQEDARLPEGLGPNGDYPGAYGMSEIGFNYRITDIQCALGRSQLAKLDGFVARRRALAAHYDTALPRLGDLVSRINWDARCRPAYHLYPVQIGPDAGLARGAIMQGLREQGIGTQVHYIPVHRQPYYADRYGVAELPGADAYFDRVISLPIFVDMTLADVDRVVDALGEVLVGAAA
ncbi:MAG: UDP-4-amino-4,6-dideoxy-N-acetyl-beta-L-altrosamine transaminase [Rhodospirillaceae bacterium]|jgi:UDP-4-amino-4,6-dideoxy-N-acetyl-beta-L-altrosamine transaminase|nr:UDP-4-amino-4,6-dideoxy-N-acetyl-beta-L-altrosamine transaminase [Rhodospirillaceae bacterium]MBT3808980.1 UDP-4-amino-4,6-dideoxy-N-acetyl-beta-L-altrosamine transaminase [Rhodospirillaceae bacterium]MBT3931733.1 UDP-4-amino-4,6-dideoxy-N-acetyl-beta-L-altrosamine transaminase [Rhodospirillaceae bacterium]MBT4773554.1 UDP-4-amino-4,6-dideoxy-N-acetyl-beta-L-altrosamine transaminase [Rhodospirillaceae bacterium]MBT5357997.1 UDP-4-amino-4,6-dideoxy-N-acetyl-beta-L-altrosamine transaminase [Rh